MNIKNKKILFIILAAVVVVILIFIFAFIHKKNTDKSNTSALDGENISISETGNNNTDNEQIETVTDKNGQVITQVSPAHADNNSDSSDPSKDSENNKSSNRSGNGGVNEMDDIFTDEAIENTTTKKNSQNATDKKDEHAETKPANDDGWSDFY